jgi:hypothetical protein
MATRKTTKKSSSATKAAPRKTASGKTVAKKTAAKKAAVKKMPAKKAPAKKAPVKKVAASKNASTKPAAKKTTVNNAARKTAAKQAVKKTMVRKSAATRPALPKQAPAKKAVAKQAPRAVASGAKTAKQPVVREDRKKSAAAPRKSATARKPTPRQALAATRKLLEQKQAHDRELQPWQLLDGQHAHVPDPGFQSHEAADKATELHAAESRMKAIQGSAGTQDRRNQGKRDNR